MSPNKYTGPWAPGMLTTDGQRIVVVDVAWIVAVRYDWIRQGGTGYDRWCIDSELGRGMRPDFKDGATVGALAGVVREMYGEPTVHARPAHVDRISDAEPVIVWYIERAHEDDHEWLRESGAWGSMPDGHRDPPICCDTEHDAWLAAYHAHPSVVSPASPPVWGDATDLGVDRG